MALFGKKKDEASAAEGTPPSSAATGNSPNDPNTFDFEAISRDLDAQNGASSFDALLASPVSATASPGSNAATSSVFPNNDSLGLSSPLSPNGNTAPIGNSPDAVINAPLSSTTPVVPAATPTTGVAPSDIALNSLPQSNGKKPVPIIPLLGALGLVAVVGGGAMFLLNSNNSDPTLQTTTPPIAISNTVASTGSSTSLSGSNTAPVPPTRSGSPGMPPTGVQSSRRPNVVIRVPVVSNAPSATQGLDTGLASRLKALWQAGADAKHRGDNAAARQAWGEALRLRPGHPGFQEALDKLPR